MMCRPEPKELVAEAASEELLVFDLPGYLCVIVRPAVRYVEVLGERDLSLLLRRPLDLDLHVADGAFDGRRGFGGVSVCLGERELSRSHLTFSSRSRRAARLAARSASWVHFPVPARRTRRVS
jgi:hypothetical protein